MLLQKVPKNLIRLRQTMSIKLLGLDLETGADFSGSLENNFITEGGFAVWDAEYNQPVIIKNTLVIPTRPIVPEAVQYTGITTEMAQRYGTSLENFLKGLAFAMEQADYIVAHNGNKFDKPLLEHQFAIAGIPMPEKPWIDTMTDVPYPGNCMSKNLTYLAGFHKILNSFPHRAVTDVLTMLEVLAKYDLNEVIQISQSPTLTIQADVNYDTKEKAKAFKFWWDAPNKRWLKELKSCYYEKESKQWDFGHKILDDSK